MLKGDIWEGEEGKGWMEKDGSDEGAENDRCG